jgi:hypothetical protein
MLLDLLCEGASRVFADRDRVGNAENVKSVGHQHEPLELLEPAHQLTTAGKAELSILAEEGDCIGWVPQFISFVPIFELPTHCKP